MSVIGSNILAGASGAAGGAAGGYQIERSLRFNSADSAYLQRTATSTGNRKTWTWSGWFKRSKLGIYAYPFDTNNGSQYVTLQFLGAGDIDHIRLYMDGFSPLTPASITLVTDAKFRDTSAWMHLIVAVDTTQTTDSDRVKIYINGVAQTFKSGSYPPLDGQTAMNNSGGHHSIGKREGQSGYWDGYLAEIHHVDGQQLNQYDFGEFDANGVWQPIEYTGTYGTNGYYLDFSDNSSTTTIAEDSSGNGNNFTAYNISVAAGANNDSLFDSPTNGTQTDTGLGGQVSGNYATWNPLNQGSNMVLKNGNLDIATTTGTSAVTGTIGVSSGKWYWETTINASNDRTAVGIAKAGMNLTDIPGDQDALGWSYYADGGTKRHNSTSTAYGASFDSGGDVIGCAFDADNGTLTFYKNGVSQGTAFTGLTDGPYFPATGDGSGVNNANSSVNFGQRAFAYTAPSGFKALNTANLSDPTIADGSDYMDVVTYSGNGSTQTISGLEFSPDFVWIKPRNVADHHILYDSVRGVRKQIYTNLTNAEETETQGLSAFTSNGFTVNGTHTVRGQTNDSGSTYVGWTWDAGTSTVSNTDGSITSSVRANQSAGFSIVSYTGTGAAGTVGHGLNAAPKIVIFKNRDAATNWRVYTTMVDGSMDSLFLNTTAAKTDSSLSAFTSSVFYCGTNPDHNGNNQAMLAYCFAPVEGYSAFGSYTGNGQNDGTFVYTGFRPRFIMWKRSNLTTSWTMYDTERQSGSLNGILYPNLNNQENLTTNIVDILSNGFKLRVGTANYNSLNDNYIYVAFAENPIKYARAR